MLFIRGVGLIPREDRSLTLRIPRRIEKFRSLQKRLYCIVIRASYTKGDTLKPLGRETDNLIELLNLGIRPFSHSGLGECNSNFGRRTSVG